MEEKEDDVVHAIDQRFKLDYSTTGYPITAKTLGAICSALAETDGTDTEWVVRDNTGSSGVIAFEKWRYI